MIAELQGERQRLEEAIQALERLAANKGRRQRGRSSLGATQEVNPSSVEDPEEADE